jgi:hypothetical protein
MAIFTGEHLSFNARHIVKLEANDWLECLILDFLHSSRLVSLS